jgi:hypothetical protein
MMDKAKWWTETKLKYPFGAEAPTSIKPHLVSDCGQHASVVLRVGWREWGFENESDRDKFVLQYNAFRK